MNKITLGIAIFAGAIASAGVSATRLSDVRGTIHNLAHPDNLTNYTLASGPFPDRTVVATSRQPGVCVFCHTAHTNSTSTPPLWNKSFPLSAYATYTSSSLDALGDQGITELGQPDDNSKMCLSCHDGTIAIGTVAVLNGLTNQTIDLNGTSFSPVEGAMPASRDNVDTGDNTGYTRRLGVDLRNDHPISVNYTSSLAIRDGELREVDTNQKSVFDNGRTIGPREDLGQHHLPLFGVVGWAQVQCPTCHDPHVRDDNPAVGNQKFLRLNRFQEAQPSALFSETNDIICLGCHEKGGSSWAYSAHANSQVAVQEYLSAPGNLREFPANLKVWKASCLNCHDTHTVEGARRLLREGTDSLLSPKAGGNPASEETCFQCHTTTASSIIDNALSTVPDIWTDYQPGNIRMPLRSSDQATGTEMHDIGGNFDDGAGVNCSSADNTCGADFVERRSQLGLGNLSNRHAECTDCHNPHRVVKFKDFRGNPVGNLAGTPNTSGTHKHEAGHTNIASGVLRGMTGVEPVYSNGASFQEMPTDFIVKRGDPGSSADESVGASHVTREYQVCLKCHSNYGYTDDNTYPIGNRPNLGDSAGGTPIGTNGLTQFTNQAKEFQAPLTHKQEVTRADSGASGAYSTNNHRSWHPVMDNTGRTPAIRGGLDPGTFRSPWNGAGDIGNQTMYCSDCHGSATNLIDGVEPVGGENGSSWGPHGSSNSFLLKGPWTENVGEGTPDALCFRCHNYDHYANPVTAAPLKSGFSCTGVCTTVAPNASNNLHIQHASRMNSTATPMRCTQCHEAVSHGWKNKALLVNLNDVGAEADPITPGVKAAPYSQQPYYLGARLRVTSFAISGEWTASNCTGSCHH